MNLRTALRALCTTALVALALGGAYAGTARAAVTDETVLTTSFVDTAGGKVSGACVEFWTEVDGDLGEKVATSCVTTGTSIRTLPYGHYILHEIQPPNLLLDPDGFNEEHVYLKADDEHVVLDSPEASATLRHEPGAQVEAVALLPDGGGTSSCFVAKLRNEGGRIVDQACSGQGASATLYVPVGLLRISQTNGPAGYGLADDALLDDVAVDGHYTVTMTMRNGASIVVQQKGQDSGLAEGGCYSVYRSPTAGAEEFWSYVCDGDDSAGTDGVVHVDDLQPDRYRLVEAEAPAGYKIAGGDIFVGLQSGEDQTVIRHHEPLPVLSVETVDAGGAALAGSCWRVYDPGEYEGYVAQACDAADGAADGTTRFTTLPPGDYELSHYSAPNGYRTIDDLTPFTMADSDVELGFTVVSGGVAPRDVILPFIQGTLKAGARLTGAAGTWSGDAPIAYAFQWLQCDVSGDPCTPIGGATSQTYTVRTSDAGRTLRLDVKASNPAGVATVLSAATSRIVWTAPVAVFAPRVYGTMRVGIELKIAARWSGTLPMTFAYQWLRCDASGDGCSPIAGETGATHVLTQADVGSTLRVEVVASNVEGTTTVRSAPTDLLPPRPPVATVQPSVSGDMVLGGKNLLGSRGRWAGAIPMTFGQQWLRCDASGESCVPIDGATGMTYRLTQADVRSTIRFEVTAANVDGTTSARSAARLMPPNPPHAITQPFVVGTVRVGSILTGNVGRWSGTLPLSFSTRWLHCDDAGESCTPIDGATDRTYVIAEADRGSTFRFEATVVNVDDTTVGRSAATAFLPPKSPHASVLPIITGGIEDGRLVGGIGRWTGTTPMTFAYQWLRCDVDGESCVPIDGATYMGYTVRTARDGGHRLRFQVTATNADGTGTARSLPTSVVPPGR